MIADWCRGCIGRTGVRRFRELVDGVHCADCLKSKGIEPDQIPDKGSAVRRRRARKPRKPPTKNLEHLKEEQELVEAFESNQFTYQWREQASKYLGWSIQKTSAVYRRVCRTGLELPMYRVEDLILEYVRKLYPVEVTAYDVAQKFNIHDQYSLQILNKLVSDKMIIVHTPFHRKFPYRFSAHSPVNPDFIRPVTYLPSIDEAPNADCFVVW